MLSCSRNGSEHGLPSVPDDIDFGVVGDGLERDVRHALINEAVTDIAARGLRARRGATGLRFLLLAPHESRPTSSKDTARP